MEESKKYESIRHAASIAGFLIDTFLLIYLLASGWSLWIRDYAESFSRSAWIAAAIYVLVIGGVFKLIDLPLTFYSDYVLEHRFGLSRESLRNWINDQIKGLAIEVPLSIAIVGGIYQLLRAYPDSWWIYDASRPRS
jgi:STE24 endopeptidase